MSRPKLCFVAPNAYPVLSGRTDIEWVGGAEVQQVVIAKGLAARGFDVSMICLDFGQPDRTQIDGITVLRAFRREAGFPVLRFVYPRITSLWSCMRRAEADIYYQRGAGFLTGIVVKFCREYGRRSVFAVAGETKIRFARDRWIFRYGAERADKIFVQNQIQAKHIRTAYGRDSEIVPNIYSPVAIQKNVSRDEILWVATFRRLKRPQLFLDLARALPEYKFTMVGGQASGDATFFDQIRTNAGQLSNVRFLGYLPYEGADECFNRGALLVNTSETEGFPNTFLQAWARGIPTLSFIDSGARLDGKGVGRVAETWGHLRNSIIELMSNPDLRAAEGERCRSYFEKHHSAETVLDTYERRFIELGRFADVRSRH